MVLRILLFLVGASFWWYSFAKKHIVRVSSSPVAHKGMGVEDCLAFV